MQRGGFIWQVGAITGALFHLAPPHLQPRSASLPIFGLAGNRWRQDCQDGDSQIHHTLSSAPMCINWLLISCFSFMLHHQELIHGFGSQQQHPITSMNVCGLNFTSRSSYSSCICSYYVPAKSQNFHFTFGVFKHFTPCVCLCVSACIYIWLCKSLRGCLKPSIV